MKLTNLAKHNSILLLAVCGLLLAACSGLIPAPTPTSSPVSATETPTPTIVWFPSTNTPTALPADPPAPTEELRPGVGELIFSDSFDRPELWDTVHSQQASAMVAGNRLLLSISDPGPLSILSLRSQPVVNDFYAEARVDISLCSGKDQYGMLFRASGNQDFYRFTINCNGQVRAERVRAGETYPLIDWLSSSDASLGAPAQVRLGVWAAGREIRVFLNDHYQFSVPDPVFSAGTIGFFVYANGQTPVTVSFSDLSVYSVSYSPPTPTSMQSSAIPPSSTPNP
jgi:hypothetical protein